jgi:hypothetical protein
MNRSVATRRDGNVVARNFRLNEAADAGVASRGTLMLPSFSPAE